MLAVKETEEKKIMNKYEACVDNFSNDHVMY